MPQTKRLTTRRVSRVIKPRVAINPKLKWSFGRLGILLFPFSFILPGDFISLVMFDMQFAADCSLSLCNDITMATSLHPNLTVMKSRAFDTLFTKIRDVETNSGDFVHYSKWVHILILHVIWNEVMLHYRYPTSLSTAVFFAYTVHSSFSQLRRAMRLLAEEVREK